jgi:nitrate/nitrite transport system substrate-binding protein
MMAHSQSTTLEKEHLEICFIPIICAAPLIYAHSHNIFARHGLSVSLRSAPGWSGIKDLMVYEKVDAVHMLAPMPLACSLGLDGKQVPIKLTAVQNVNGQALTLSTRHLGIRDVRDMRGFTFGVPYRYSMHYYLLCFLLAQQGLNPLRDVTIQEVTPPLMPYYLEQERVDGVFAPEPFNQIPVNQGTGFIFILSRDIWPGHPCCSLATSQTFINHHPHTYRAMMQSLVEAEWLLHCATPAEKHAVAQEISGPLYLNQSDTLPIEQVLSGDFPDGRGERQIVSDRIDFLPYPWESYGTWILEHMERWEQLPVTVDYRELVESVFDIDTSRDIAMALGFNLTSQPALPPPLPPAAPAPSPPHPAPSRTSYQLSPVASQRLQEILSQLAEVAGGNTDLQLAVTSHDELGLLEQMLNEMVRNMRFAHERLAERALSQELLAQQVIDAQRDALRELSTPLIPISDDVVIMPLIGTIDSQRAQQVMETLLEGVARHQSRLVILDITGVHVVDTQVAQAFIQAAQAVRLLGAQVMLTGIQPQIAQTLVGLGVDLSGIQTQGTLQAGIASALRQ